MVTEGRAQYADPASMIRAAAMLIGHIGYTEKSQKLEMALDVCGQYEKKLAITGRNTGATGKDFTDYILSWLDNPKLKETWEGYIKG
jgi:isocitrate/isopropylmalate dehydrogenase